MDIQNSLRQHGFELYESLPPTNIWENQNIYIKKLSIVNMEGDNQVYLRLSTKALKGKSIGWINASTSIKREGIWWDFQGYSYSIPIDELHRRLPDVERKITQALSRL